MPWRTRFARAEKGGNARAGRAVRVRGRRQRCAGAHCRDCMLGPPVDRARACLSARTQAARHAEDLARMQVMMITCCFADGHGRWTLCMHRGAGFDIEYIIRYRNPLSFVLEKTSFRDSRMAAYLLAMQWHACGRLGAPDQAQGAACRARGCAQVGRPHQLRIQRHEERCRQPRRRAAPQAHCTPPGID